MFILFLDLCPDHTRLRYNKLDDYGDKGTNIVKY